MGRGRGPSLPAEPKIHNSPNFAFQTCKILIQFLAFQFFSKPEKGTGFWFDLGIDIYIYLVFIYFWINFDQILQFASKKFVSLRHKKTQVENNMGVVDNSTYTETYCFVLLTVDKQTGAPNGTSLMMEKFQNVKWKKTKKWRRSVLVVITWVRFTIICWRECLSVGRRDGGTRTCCITQD